jgi:hypothetical protein
MLYNTSAYCVKAPFEAHENARRSYLGSKINLNCLFQAELVDYWGYQFEEHHVLTSDGYILGIHRIPGAKNEGPVTESKPVALLAHGLLASSSQWIFGPAYNSMGYALADEGVQIFFLCCCKQSFKPGLHPSFHPYNNPIQVFIVFYN